MTAGIYKKLELNILQDGYFNLEWEDTEEEISKSQKLLQEDIFTHYQKDYNNFLFYLGFTDLSVPLSEGLIFIRSFSNLFIKRLLLTPDLKSLRENATVEIDNEEIENILSESPFIPGIEFLNNEKMRNNWLALNDEYKKEIKAYTGKAEEFFKTYSADMHLAGRVYFHLVENKNEETPFAFLATYTTSPGKQGTSQHIPLKNALSEYGRESKKLLELISTIQTAANKSPLINELLGSGEIFHPLSFTANEALQILKEIPLYEKCGILCRIPNWWKNKAKGARLNIRVGSRNQGFVGKDALLDFNPEILLGDDKISLKEAKDLLNQSDGLAFIKGKWIEVNQAKLNEILKAYEKTLDYAEDGISLKDAMRFELLPEKKSGIADSNDLSISKGEWFETVIKNLTKPDLIDTVSPGKDFKAELRPYQEKGLNWLYFLNTLRLGACLADDMGLGKTIQLLAFLNTLKNRPDNNKPNLLIIPASLISNWVNEIEKFAPSLKYYIAHSSYSDIPAADFTEAYCSKFDLVITTYSFIVRYDLNAIQWNYIILDEAQAIKNPDTKQTKSVKRLKAQNKIILTGTPVENRLSDLWSLFDFLNPGLLGNTTEFNIFSKSLKNSPEGYGRLKKIISPFILRRLKTDKSIISDLPEKIEMKTYSELTKKQIVLYAKQVEDLEAALNNSQDGIAKKGLILSSLIKFKQLCNHPDQFLGQSSYNEEESGKFLRLKEICETIYEKRERAIVFTQFAEITNYLSDYLESIFNHKGVVLHGGVQVKKRKEIVERFQSHEYVPFMVLSLKAGGVGLNLTQASHVIHFDRWWNPAVENQATDRAFRIGQKKNVIVHKFIAKGTIEEKIDKMIEDKKSLSNELIGESSEAWITELDNKKLIELFTLTI